MYRLYKYTIIYCIVCCSILCILCTRITILDDYSSSSSPSDFHSGIHYYIRKDLDYTALYNIIIIRSRPNDANGSL